MGIPITEITAWTTLEDVQHMWTHFGPEIAVDSLDVRVLLGWWKHNQN
jgi:hypothetical protein